MKNVRDPFREKTFNRDGYKCVNCGAEAQDAHHLLERRLWTDGGYHLDNLVSLCGPCHILAEKTEISVEDLRRKAGITRIHVPPHMEQDESYDKWGNVYLSNGLRAPGELFWDPSVQKVLSEHLDEFVPYMKYPRTMHLPYSPGATDDDRVWEYNLLADHDVVITEKLDGENTTMYHDHIHARSIDSAGHPSRSWVKNYHAQIAHLIPRGMRVCGENLYAKHAIDYTLPSYFLVFSIWEGPRCLSWDDTLEWCELLDLYHVPVLYRGKWDGTPLPPSVAFPTFGEEIEGYVVRKAESFSYRAFQNSVGKYVRANHVNPGTQHWFSKEVIPNKTLDDQRAKLYNVYSGYPSTGIDLS